MSRPAAAPSSPTCPWANGLESRSPAASTPAARSPGCARTARSRTPSPPTSASTTSQTSPRSRPERRATARRRRCSSTAATHLRERALTALRCGAFHIQTAGRRYFKHDSARTRRHGDPARARDGRARRRDLGRRLDVQRKRHRAVLPLRDAREPAAPDLQAVARRSLRDRARRPNRDERVADRRAAWRTAPHRNARTRPTRTSSAPRTRRKILRKAARNEHDDRRADHGRPLLGSGRRDRV